MWTSFYQSIACQIKGLANKLSSLFIDIVIAILSDASMMNVVALFSNHTGPSALY